MTKINVSFESRVYLRALRSSEIMTLYRRLRTVPPTPQPPTPPPPLPRYFDTVGHFSLDMKRRGATRERPAKINT